jgi:hypothetical protein
MGPGAGGKLHDAMAAGYVRAREALRPHERAHADERLTTWLDAFEDEMRDAIEPLLRSTLDHPDTPPEVRDALADVVGTEHATGVSLLFAVVGALFYPLVSATMTGAAQAVQQQSLRAHPNTPLSPAEIALGAVRHTLGTINADDEALKSGIDSDRMRVIELNTGDSPAIGDLLLLYRRGLIPLDDPDPNVLTLTKGLRQSRVRDEWQSAIIELQYAPPSAGEVITGALKGHLDDFAAIHKLSQAGIDPDNYEWLRASAGRPPGTQEMLHLWNRNAVKESDVDDAVRQSDINDHYLPFVKELRWYVPPVRSIMAMLRSGAIDDTKATALFTENGVRAADIPGYLAEAHHGRTQAVKQLSQSQLVRMYVDGILDHATVATRLVGLGYQLADADLLLQLADDTRHERYVNALIAQMHSRYVAHKATDTDVQTALGAAGVASATITELLRLWALARGATVHQPTPAQVVHAYRAEYISAASCRRLLLAAGVQADDIGITVAAGFPPTSSHRPQIDAVVNA